MRLLRTAAIVALALAGSALVPRPAAATVYMTTEQALDLAFPGCEVVKETHFLSEDQAAAIAARAGVPLHGRLVPAYRGRCQGRPAGTAYFDTHPVRTLPETLMIAVDPAGRVARVELVSFREPAEYRAPQGWLATLLGHVLDDGLALKRDIVVVTGATLTSRATVEAVRRVLAIDAELRAAAAATAAATTAPAAATAP